MPQTKGIKDPRMGRLQSIANKWNKLVKPIVERVGELDAQSIKLREELDRTTLRRVELENQITRAFADCLDELRKSGATNYELPELTHDLAILMGSKNKSKEQN